MMNVTGRRPFSKLGDQQLLDQTRRLAANQRCIEVHILDHLDEIDRRGLALRRGFSSLFDYAVRELRFTDAAAQRRIQAMRLCRRHGWVRASLQSGELSLTAAAQLETTFAGAERAERAERQCRTGRRNVGQTRQLGLPAAPSEAGERGERGPRPAPGLAPPAGECSGDAAAVNTPAVPVARYAVAQAPGTGHAGALLPRPELNGNASPFPVPSCDPASAAPSSDEGPAPQIPPPTNLPMPVRAPVPAPVVAPSESLRAASRAPESSQDDPLAELSPGSLSAAPLLHPQRQRELIEQAAGMSTRQVAGLLAAAAPEEVPPRDTLRAVAPDRYTLKVSIDQECEQGLRLLKGLLSHLDPRMSWGDLIARVVREAVARHDPLAGGSGQRRRQSAGSAGASPRQAPKKTRAAGAPAGPAQGGNESSGRAPSLTRAAGAAAGPAQGVSESSGRAPSLTRAAGAAAGPAQGVSESSGRAPSLTRAAGAAAGPAQGVSESSGRAPSLTRAAGAAAGPAQGVSESSGRAPSLTRPAAAPAAPVQRGGGDTPATQGDTAAAGRQNPIAMLANATAAPRFAAGAAADGSHVGAAVPVSPVATPAPEPVRGVSPDGGPSGASAGAAAGASADGSHVGAAVPVSPVATPAPEPVRGVFPDGGPGGASAGVAGGASADGSHADAGVPVSPVATPAPEPAPGVVPDGGPPGASAGAAAHTTRDSVHRRHQSPPRRPIPAAVRRHIWQRDEGRCCYRDPLTGRRCTSSHLLQIDHLLPVAQGGGPEPFNLQLSCFAHHRMRHGHGPAPPPEPPM